MKEEEIIRKHDSGRRPFTVPEGYFTHFDARLAERMKHEGLMGEAVDTKQMARRVALSPFHRVVRYAAAAVFTGLCIGSAVYLLNHQMGNTMADMEFAMTDSEVDAVLDCEMMNNNEIAYYLTEAY